MSHAWLWPGAPFLTFFSAGLIVIGLWLLLGGTRTWSSARLNHARDILDERYAAGDLSTEEYRERRENLRER